jgi:hypothetical protein
LDLSREIPPIYLPYRLSFLQKKGRAIERSLGKPMRITLKSTDETNIRLAAQAIGYTITQFRTAILVSWAVDEGLLGQKNNS